MAANSGTLLSGEFTRDGGGVYQSGAGGLTAASSLFGSVSDPDFAEYAGHVSAVNSLFQSTRGVGLTGTNNLVGVDPLLSTSGLRNNGGPVQTVALQSASPAIGQTGNPQGFLTDGRGDALPASVSLDIGNYQTQAIVDKTPPTATLTAPDVTTANAASLDPYTFTIVYQDNLAVDQAGIPGTVVEVQPAGGGTPLAATLVSISPSGVNDPLHDAVTETATYRLTPPGGSWSTAVSGTYSVILAGAPVTDLAGNAVPAGTLGEFAVQLGPDQLVITAEPPSALELNTSFGVTVTAENTQGGVLTGFNGDLTITLAANPGGSTLGGTLIMTASDGVATFSGLTLDNPGVGYTLQVTSGGPLSAATTTAFNVASAVVVVVPTPPQVLSIQILKAKGALRQIVVHYNVPMNQASAVNRNNYSLVDAGADHIFGNRNDRSVALKALSFSSAQDTVTLTLKKPDSLKHSLRLTINAQPPAGVQSEAGTFLNATAGGATT